MDEKTCLTTYCEECMLEEFTKLVKENVYYKQPYEVVHVYFLAEQYLLFFMNLKDK